MWFGPEGPRYTRIVAVLVARRRSGRSDLDSLKTAYQQADERTVLEGSDAISEVEGCEMTEKNVIQINLPEWKALALYEGYSLAILALAGAPLEDLGKELEKWRDHFGDEELRSLELTLRTAVGLDK